MKLFHTPGTRSLAPIIVAEWLDIKLDLRKVDLQNLDSYFLSLSPLGQVPVLEMNSGECKTQVDAILQYFCALNPEGKLVGKDIFDWFEIDRRSPYMLLVAPVKQEKCYSMTEEQKELFGIEKLNIPRSEIPAITHVDYSARVQTVHSETNPRFYKLLEAFETRTGCPVLVNTSFNVRGEPIVCTPEDAYRCFMRTEMDYLVLENFLLSKEDQPEWKEDGNWRDEYELD